MGETHETREIQQCRSLNAILSLTSEAILREDVGLS